MTTNIYMKMLQLRETILYLQKDTKGHNYNYTSGTTLMSQIRPKMDELGLLLFTNVRNQKLDTEGSKYLVSAEMVYTWINAENPQETIETVLFGAGVDNQDPSKAIGKMMTYFERYNLLKTFQIATDNDDPDRFQQKQEFIEKKSEKIVSKPKTSKRKEPNPPSSDAQADISEASEQNVEEQRQFFIQKIEQLVEQLENTGVDMILDFEEKAKCKLKEMNLNYLKRAYTLLNNQKVDKKISS